MKTLDYINVRDAQVHGLVNPTFIMYGNCSLKDYSFEVTVDGKKREARFLPDLASDNYELTLSLSKDDSKVKVYLIHDDQKELVCVRKNTLIKRIKSKIRTLLQKTVRKTKETNKDTQTKTSKKNSQTQSTSKSSQKTTTNKSSSTNQSSSSTHEHVWKDHKSKRWVSKMVTVTDYET